MSRVFQAVSTLSHGDAVGNDVMAIRRILKEAGYETDLFAGGASAKISREVYHLWRNIPRLRHDDVLIYHLSIGTQMNYDLAKMNGKKVIIYHNITPPTFFEKYSEGTFTATTEGLKEAEFLADVADYAIADSNYNKKDLIRMGYTCPIDVCPIVIPFADYDQKPDQLILDSYRNDGWTNLLFVGRIAPNKKQENVIRAFYAYKKLYNTKSRLFLVGSFSGMENYCNRLKDYAQKLGLEDSVVFTGHIRFDEILAYYHLADAFVCMSEHEGFCVPLAEAMYLNVPIIAYDTSAIGDTLGGSGILLDDNRPEFAAAVINRVITDEQLRESILDGQRKRLEDFKYENVKKLFLTILNRIEKGK